MTLSIILLNYFSDTHTLDCLKSLKTLKWKGKLHIIVSDNGSFHHFAQKLKANYPDTIYIKNPQNLGFTGGNNTGIKHALSLNSDLIMMLNNDTKVDPNLAINLYQALKPKSIGITVPKIYFYPGFEFHRSRYTQSQLGKVIWYAGGHIDWANVLGIHHGVDQVDKGQFSQSHTIEFATGCCMMIKRLVIETIGDLDQKYFLYLEDADFSQRALKVGFKIKYVPQAKLWHKNAESTGGSGSALQDYFFTRNQMLFGLKYAPLKTRLALIKQSFKFLRTGRKWQKVGVRDYYLKKLEKGSYPVKN